MSANEDEEIERLLEIIFQRYGYDFRSYARSSMKRRILSAMTRTKGLSSVSDLTARVIDSPAFCKDFVSHLSVNVTEMFRDPNIYRALREHVFPVLRTYPSIRIWHAGCATGEEVYSMAILLTEAGLYEKSFLYGTDINFRAIETAKAGIYPADLIRSYTSNYQKAGGSGTFSDYYTAKYEFVKMKSSLSQNILFSQHNLVTDDIFSEMHIIFCRNVLIYFSKELQERVLDLFNRALVRRGFMCLGSKETLEFTGQANLFETISKMDKIYRKKAEAL